MEKTNSTRSLVLALFILTAVILSLVSCGPQKESAEKSRHAARLAGTWVLDSRMTDEGEVPAKERIMKIIFDGDGTFVSDYRGEQDQKWVKAGKGGFSFDPPFLNLYWDQGTTTALLVTDLGPDKLVFSHGRSLIPLKDQEPLEIFVRRKIEKGPTRQPS